MKNLKMLQAALVITVLSIVVGCSDQITSSGETGSSKKDEGVISQGLESEKYSNPTFNIQIILKGYARYDIDKFTTGLDKFYSVDITNLSPDENKIISDCSGLLVYNNEMRMDKSIGCHSQGFDYKSLIIENTSASYKKLDITVSGAKIDITKQIISQD